MYVSIFFASLLGSNEKEFNVATGPTPIVGYLIPEYDISLFATVCIVKQHIDRTRIFRSELADRQPNY